MSRRAKVITCSEADRVQLEALASSRVAEARLVQRAQFVVACLNGTPVRESSARFGVRPNTVIFWRNRFAKFGVDGLFDETRCGRPVTYGEELRDRVLQLLGTAPPLGQARWDGPAIANVLNVSVHAVWRLMRKEGICLSRQRSWCVSTDPEFTTKAADIVGLYLNPPENAMVISIDEKPSIQALERTTGYVETSNGKIVRGLKSTYKRNGTLNLFAALNVATGSIQAQTTTLKRRVEFLAFMDQVVTGIPDDREIHVILDNYCIHKRNHDWLSQHKNVTFHFTPTSASWLNMVEIWFGILTRKALRGASFKSTEDLRHAIEAFIAVYSQKAKPFVWRKREVKGSQIRDTIVNLCN
jgi:transposase